MCLDTDFGLTDFPKNMMAVLGGMAIREDERADADGIEELADLVTFVILREGPVASARADHDGRPVGFAFRNSIKFVLSLLRT